MSRTVLEQLVSRLRRRSLAAALLLVVLALAPLAILAWRMPIPDWLMVGWAALALAIGGAWLESRWHRIRPDRVAAHLDRELDSLEDSTGLLLADRSALPPLQRLQRDRVAERMGSLPSGVLPWPGRPLMAAGAGALVLGVVFAGLPIGTVDPLVAARVDALPAGDLETVRVRVTPPTYTGAPSRWVEGLDVDAEQGAGLDFRFQFQTAVSEVRLRLDDGTVLEAIDPSGRSHRIGMNADADRIYRLEWRDASGVREGGFHRLRLIRDQPPVLTVVEPGRSPALVPVGSEPVADFVLEAVDDHGLGQGRILATVAKGEGEGVKFRDVEMDFDQAQIGARDGRWVKRWQLTDLGMEPGDELYFRAEVRDNREPAPNVARTAMLLLRWEAGEARPGLAIEGIAVDLLPEYFRSQRQIIIDTERLIEEADQIGLAEGQRRSRSLAFDQKSLRIRYGQYLGEEYSSDIGGSAQPVVDEEHGEESFAEHLAHANEHDHGGAESGSGSGSPVASRIESLPDFMADFVHTHDSAEQATLFDNKTRETLKAALAAMWDSELELHLSRPRQALPHEYRALDLLKQVQQANRIYVKRVGFEPPPLDTDRQLTGELDDAAGIRLTRAPGPAPAGDERRALETLLADGISPAQRRAALVAWRNRVGEDPESLELRLAMTRILSGSAEGDACEDCWDTVLAAAFVRLTPPEATVRRPLELATRERAAEYRRRLAGEQR